MLENHKGFCTGRLLAHWT